MFEDLLEEEKKLREIAKKENALGLIDIFSIGSFDDTLEFEDDIFDNDTE